MHSPPGKVALPFTLRCFSYVRIRVNDRLVTVEGEGSGGKVRVIV